MDRFLEVTHRALENVPRIKLYIFHLKHWRRLWGQEPAHKVKSVSLVHDDPLERKPSP